MPTAHRCHPAVQRGHRLRPVATVHPLLARWTLGGHFALPSARRSRPALRRSPASADSADLSLERLKHRGPLRAGRWRHPAVGTRPSPSAKARPRGTPGDTLATGGWWGQHYRGGALDWSDFDRAPRRARRRWGPRYRCSCLRCCPSPACPARANRKRKARAPGSATLRHRPATWPSCCWPSSCCRTAATGSCSRSSCR